MPDAEARRLWHALARRSSLVDVVEEGLRSLTEEERQALLGRLAWVAPPGPGWTLTRVSHRQERRDGSAFGGDGELRVTPALDVCTGSVVWERAAEGPAPEPPCRACEFMESGTCQFCGRVASLLISGMARIDDAIDPTPLEFTDRPPIPDRSYGPADRTSPTDHYMQVREDAGRCLSWVPALAAGAFFFCEGEAGHGEPHRWRPGFPSPGPTGAVE